MRKPILHVLATALALALAVLAGTAVPGARGGGEAGAAPRSASAASGATRLQRFGSCGALLSYAKRQTLAQLGPWGLGTRGMKVGDVVAVVAESAAGGSAAAAGGRASADAPAADEFSTTNVQEEGVDEPDLVKSNGSTLFVARFDRLFAVDVSRRDPRLVGSLQLPQGASYELLLEGERLLVLSQGWLSIADARIRGGQSSGGGARAQSTLIEVNVSDPGAMRVVRSLALDGSYVSARLVGSVARIVTSTGMPQALPLVGPVEPTTEAASAALARNRAVVRTSKVGAWLPSYRVKGRRGETLSRQSLVSCSDVRRPVSYSGLGLLTVVTVDLRKGLAVVDSDSVVADGQTVYSSTDTLYVATRRWLPQPVTAATENPPSVTTAIHRFDISSPTSTRYTGSGTVPGYLLSQWSLSEHEGVLRVASTEEPDWWRPGAGQESESFVTTLGERDGSLVQLGRVGGLGKGERVYAVRFAGDRGYVVTFRQVDPLYTLDLSAPARPAVLGELKIMGYSAYLHPLGDDLLLGVGQDATAEGRVKGTQLSLFDVSDLRRPTRLQAVALGSGWSEAESDHHAFLWWNRSRLAVVPLQSWEGEPFAGAVGFRVTRNGIEERLRVSHKVDGKEPTSPVRRSLVVKDTLFTVSDSGVAATSLATFAETGRVAFPAVAPAGAGSSAGSGVIVPPSR